MATDQESVGITIVRLRKRAKLSGRTGQGGWTLPALPLAD